MYLLTINYNFSLEIHYWYGLLKLHQTFLTNPVISLMFLNDFACKQPKEQNKGFRISGAQNTIDWPSSRKLSSFLDLYQMTHKQHTQG